MTVTLSEQLMRRKPLARKKGPHAGPDLGRTIGTFALTMFGVGATVGTGIFFVLQEAVPVLPEDTEEELHERLRPVEHRLLVGAVADYFWGRVRP